MQLEVLSELIIRIVIPYRIYLNLGFILDGLVYIQKYFQGSYRSLKAAKGREFDEQFGSELLTKAANLRKFSKTQQK